MKIIPLPLAKKMALAKKLGMPINEAKEYNEQDLDFLITIGQSLERVKKREDLLRGAV